MEFVHHAFPLIVVSDLDAIGSPALSHNMPYTAAQAMFYLVDDSWHIQLLSEMDKIHPGCDAREAEYKHQIFELEKDTRSFDRK